MKIGKEEETTYPGIPVGRIIEECVVAACAPAMKESRRADVSFIATMTEVQQAVRSSSWSVLRELETGWLYA